MPRRRIAPPPRDPQQFAPVFVLAAPRSCSSVITTMIGQHPELAGMPELKLFCCATIGEMAASLPRYWIERGFTHRSPGLVRALAEVEFGGQELEHLVAAQDWLRERPDWSGADVLDGLMTRLGPRIAVEKSPENAETADSLARLAAAYPNAHYIHLTRHPVATQHSMARHWRRLTGQPPRGQPMSGIAAWFGMNRRILDFTASLPDDRHLRIRAEDILGDLDAGLRRISTWLGLRSDDGAIEAMKHPEASVFAREGPAGSGIIGGNDPDFLADPRPHAVALPDSLAPPEGWAADPAAWRIVADLARCLGYADRIGADPHAGLSRPALRRELLRRRDADQAARKILTGYDPAAICQSIRITEDNAAWLKPVVDALGWPGLALVGEDGSHAAWLIVQHADRDLAFQRHCLALLTEAAARGEAARADAAHLTDRILLAAGALQVYGTQLHARDGRYEAPRLRDPETVDARRAAAGLDPLADHLARALALYGPPAPAHALCINCSKPVELWLPELGGHSTIACGACGFRTRVRARITTAAIAD